MTSTASENKPGGAYECDQQHDPALVVLTGGPGGERPRCWNLSAPPPAATSGSSPRRRASSSAADFPRRDGFDERRAAQRAIFHVQRELEAVEQAQNAAILLRDRGMLDGLAYWPGDAGDLWTSVSVDPERELQHYAAVIHLRTPDTSRGYDHRNPLRAETAAVAAEIDARIATV